MYALNLMGIISITAMRVVHTTGSMLSPYLQALV